ncbi:ATPase domain-containing protein [Ectothiorhodospira sp. BSL-9]|uniref:RAD55 family ATPase n=1 Tax=Ectothiorhodospira sp. BSL-9 TaxID=1442136 RepID=UPI00143933BC|nr:ATPase domain-containing protein [Ectothiorhodospira sp. BSL-9]
MAIVGDPGTGKTMLLLSFFQRARLVNNALRLASQGQGGSPEDWQWEAFDRLFQPQGQMRGAGSEYGKDMYGIRTEQNDENGHSRYLRIFVSLENPFSRMLEHHGAMLESTVDPTDGPHNGRGKGAVGSDDDVYVFIDATSLLSGRLEDMLRYPRLDKDNEEGTDARPNPRQRELHLASCGAQNQDPSRCWYAHEENGAALSLEDLLQNPDDFFVKPRDSESSREVGRPRLITLITPPVADPSERVRLLKDLLAMLLATFREWPQRVLALDSLSALLHPCAQLQAVSGNSVPSPAAGGILGEASPRRLHMLNLVRWLEEQQVTTMMACEARRTEHNTLRGHPLFLGTEERYLASGVIQLDYHRYPSGDLMRYMRVLKMRGAAHDMRGHAYDLSKNGLAWLEVLFGEAQHGGLHD